MHGFSTDTRVYDPLWESHRDSLTKSNVAVFAFDLYGRGFTDSLVEQHPYSLQTFNSCLCEFVLQLDIRTSGLLVRNGMTLVGYSMGGAIVANAIRSLAAVVKAAVLIAPSGLPVTLPFTAQLVKNKWLGGLLFPLAAQSSMDQHVSQGLMLLLCY